MEFRTSSSVKTFSRTPVLIYNDALMPENLEEGENVNSSRNQMKRGKASDDKRREKVDKRRESDERREKSEKYRRENEIPVHDAYRKGTKRCKYCGGKHPFGKRNCPAFGKRWSACGIMNHFAFQCMAKTNVNVIERERERKRR